MRVKRPAHRIHFGWITRIAFIEEHKISWLTLAQKTVFLNCIQEVPSSNLIPVTD
jgi:hypothetical protein